MILSFSGMHFPADVFCCFFLREVLSLCAFFWAGFCCSKNMESCCPSITISDIPYQFYDAILNQRTLQIAKSRGGNYLNDDFNWSKARADWRWSILGSIQHPSAHIIGTKFPKMLVIVRGNYPSRSQPVIEVQEL